MNIKEFLTQITTLQKDSETLQEIKDILSNDGTITLVDQIKFLQDNAVPTNILNLQKEIEKMRHSLDEAQSSHSSMYDDVSSAMRSLEDVPYDNDEIESALSRLDDLEALLTKEEEPVKKTPAKKMTTPFSDDDKNSLIDVISDGNSQQ